MYKLFNGKTATLPIEVPTLKHFQTRWNVGQKCTLSPRITLPNPRNFRCKSRGNFVISPLLPRIFQNLFLVVCQLLKCVSDCYLGPIIGGYYYLLVGIPASGSHSSITHRENVSATNILLSSVLHVHKFTLNLLSISHITKSPKLQYHFISFLLYLARFSDELGDWEGT